MNDFQSQNVSITNKTWMFRYLCRFGFIYNSVQSQQSLTFKLAMVAGNFELDQAQRGSLVSNWVKEEEKGRRGREEKRGEDQQHTSLMQIHYAEMSHQQVPGFSFDKLTPIFLNSSIHLKKKKKVLHEDILCSTL